MDVTAPGFWVAASLGLAVLAPALAWIVARRWPVLAAGPGTPALTWLVRSLYLLWPPVLAWRMGALSLYYLGLTETDWLAALGTAGLLVAAILALTLLGWLIYRRSLRYDLAAAWPGRSFEGSANPGLRAWLAPVDAALAGWHWAFYRAAAISWLAAAASLPAAPLAHVPLLASQVAVVVAAWHAQPIYWGSWLGLGLAALEWALNPFTWQALRTPRRGQDAVRAAGLAIATTALFSFTRNLWLCLVCVVTVETLVAVWLPLPEAPTA